MNKARRRLARARRYRDRAYAPPYCYMGRTNSDFSAKTDEQVSRFVAEITKRARKNNVLVLTIDSLAVQALRRLLPTHVQVASLWDAFHQSNLALNFRGYVAAFPASNFKLRA